MRSLMSRRLRVETESDEIIGKGWARMGRKRENRYWRFSGFLGDGSGALGVLSQLHSRRGSDEDKAKGFKKGKVRGHQEGYAEGYEEGLAEGEARMSKAWEEWNLRRMEAKEAGEEFREPPPSRRNGK